MPEPRRLDVNRHPTGIQFRVLSLGAGVQSSTIYWLAQRGEISPFDFAIFADTENEPKAVYDYLAILEANATRFPIIRVGSGNLATAATRIYKNPAGKSYTRRLLPIFTKLPDGTIGKMMTRGCTGEYKVEPIRKYLKTIAGIRYGQNFPTVELSLGISTDEASRMKDARWPWMVHRYPLIDANLSRQDCLALISRLGLPTPPRSSCTFCPFHSKQEWARMALESPQDFQRAVEVEKDLQTAHRAVGLKADVYLTKLGIDLDKIDWSEIREASAHSIRNQPNMFNEECSGHCGV